VNYLKLPVIRSDSIKPHHYEEFRGTAHGIQLDGHPKRGFSFLINSGLLKRILEEEGELGYIRDVLNQLPKEDVLFVLYCPEDAKLVSFEET
jgi:hypothetical protein